MTEVFKKENGLVCIPEAKFAAIIRRFGKLLPSRVEGEEAYVLSISVKDWAEAAKEGMTVVPADWTDGTANTSFITYKA